VAGLLIIPGGPNIEVLFELSLPKVPAVDRNSHVPPDLNISLSCQQILKFAADGFREPLACPGALLALFLFFLAWQRPEEGRRLGNGQLVIKRKEPQLLGKG
jgi:hypothetical protein